jgi:hypothetical protein
MYKRTAWLSEKRGNGGLKRGVKSTTECLQNKYQREFFYNAGSYRIAHLLAKESKHFPKKCS